MAPTLRPDGTLLLEEGYDPATGLILMSPPVMPIIPGKPTREEGLAALTLLDGLLEEVAFVDEPSRSVALSELITPTVRGAFACSPVHATTAATPSSGKTYVSDIASAIALGTPGVHPLAAGEKTEEFVKRLNSFLMAGFSYFAIDNMTIPLQGEEFCQAVTAPSYIPRILGKSEIKELPNTWTISANGNNLRVIADMTRRTLMCALDTKMERPELRVFQRNPVNEILAHRGRYIAAVLTVVRAYIAAGKPDQKLTPLNGFDGWTEFVRSALVWLGRVDPAETIETARRTDTELQKRQQVILAIADAFGTGGWVGEGKWPPCARTSAEMVQAATSRIIKTPDGKNPEGEALKHSGPAADALKDAFMLIAIKPNELTPNKISYWFRNNNNKLAMGFRLRSEHDRLKTAHRWIERIAMPETEFDP